VNDENGVPLYGASLTGGLSSPLTASYPFSFAAAAQWLRTRLTRSNTPAVEAQASAEVKTVEALVSGFDRRAVSR
jgi:hypothetical protein